MRSKLKLSRSLEFISALFKAQQVIDTRGGANMSPPGSDRVKKITKANKCRAYCTNIYRDKDFKHQTGSGMFVL